MFSTSTIGKRRETWTRVFGHYEFVKHYNAERFHQGLGGRLIAEVEAPSNDNGVTEEVHRRTRLGGVLNYYFRKAA